MTCMILYDYEWFFFYRTQKSILENGSTVFAHLMKARGVQNNTDLTDFHCMEKEHFYIPKNTEVIQVWYNVSFLGELYFINSSLLSKSQMLNAQ